MRATSKRTPSSMPGVSEPMVLAEIPKAALPQVFANQLALLEATERRQTVSELVQMSHSLAAQGCKVTVFVATLGKRRN